MGRPLGAAGDVVRHNEVLTAAFDLAESATENGATVEFSETYRPNPSDS